MDVWCCDIGNKLKAHIRHKCEKLSDCFGCWLFFSLPSAFVCCVYIIESIHFVRFNRERTFRSHVLAHNRTLGMLICVLCRVRLFVCKPFFFSHNCDAVGFGSTYYSQMIYYLVYNFDLSVLCTRSETANVLKQPKWDTAFRCVAVSAALNLTEYPTIFNLPSASRCRGNPKQFIRIYWNCSVRCRSFENRHSHESGTALRDRWHFVCLV